jgi:pimeloyl-ACP methyl ester carboxylesterase
VSCTPDTNFDPASKDQMEALQRLSGSPECAARYLETVADLDVRELLSQVRAPTLVTHVRDPRVPSDLGRELAAGITGARFVATCAFHSIWTGIPGAKFVTLESRNHMITGDEPANRQFFDAVFSW